MNQQCLDDLLHTYAERERLADEGGGPSRQRRQHRLGRWTARQRIETLLDRDSFVELGRHVLHRHAEEPGQLGANRHPGDGVVCGLGRVDGARVAIYAHDPTVLRGSIGQAAAQKICRILDLAYRDRLPVIAFADSDGARVAEGCYAMDGCAEIMRRMVALRGRSLQITVACGLCVGAAAYNAALSDLVAMVEGQSFMFIAGAKVTKVVTGEDLAIEDLGGPNVHSRHSGVCHAVLESEEAGVAWIKRTLSFLRPTVAGADRAGRANRAGRTDRAGRDRIDRTTRQIGRIVPTDLTRGYDMRKVLAVLFDREQNHEFAPAFAPNLLTLFGRLDGRAVAILASQPAYLAGALDAAASRKGADFVDLADAMGLPLFTIVDVPGYFPGRQQEEQGVLYHGAELIRAYARARVPQICLIIRKNYGAGSVLTASAHVRLALPTARIGAMGTDAAVAVVFGPALEGASEDEVREREQFRAQWSERFDNAWAGAEEGYVDGIVHPDHARHALARALRQVDHRDPTSMDPR